ncbi:MAG: hypothetical protein Q9P44_05625 [Anaerolineae bacterium]|nr:hypothetical protein [Anaerolineae bacterium]
MAEPPLSNDELRMYAGKVIIGKVTSVSREEVEVENGTNRVYTVQVDTIREEGGFGLDLDPTMTITYWQAGDRPNGWTGSIGQFSPLPVDKEIRLYLGKKREDGVWNLLEPNGWQAVE